MIDPDRLRTALDEARELLAEATRRSGRPADACEIVLAGKYVPAEDASALVEAGVRVVGENRLQDLLAKREIVGDRLAFDFIGHLQRRKVRDVLPVVRLIHSLDSLRLAQEIASRSAGPVRVLVEVNVGEEESKSGIVPGALRGFVREVSAIPEIELGGLMGIPPRQSDPELSRPYFARLRNMLEDLAAEWHGRHEMRDLSMGTSQDYLVAAEEGATMVRVGRGLIERAEAA